MTRGADQTGQWDDVHGRPKPVEAGLADAFAQDEELIRQVYVRRARQLAERQTDDRQVATLPVLVFGIGVERYGLELSELAEVLPYRGCTPVPGAPAALLGVINVRGDIKTVADVRRILDLPAGDDSAPGYVVMLRRGDGTIGLRVESIDDIRQVDPATLVAVGDNAAPIPGSRCVKAIGADNLIVIDVTAALDGLGWQ
jgi:purine-binding chemotaxis protein CheW